MKPFSSYRDHSRVSLAVLFITCMTFGSAPRLCAQEPDKPETPKMETPKIVADTSQLEVLTRFAQQAETTATEWYPRILKILDVQNPRPRKQITLLIDFNYKGVAATSGSVISISPDYVRKHPDDLGMIVHELTHVVQGYPKYDPVWLVEGIADYVRFFHFEPVAKRPHPDPAKADARASYRTTAAFLDWTSGKYDKDLVKKLDHALREGTYKEETFQTLTGKSLDQLNTEWIAALKAAPPK